MTETRHKRGDVREDGMVFWCYTKSVNGGEWWVTPEKFAEKRARHSARIKERYASDPVFRDRQRARTRALQTTDSFREKQAARKKAMYTENPLFATACRLRSRASKVFRRISSGKPASTQELLGTDWQTLKVHIESQFVDGMSWENMSDWHIDHIIPLASAKTEEELAALCHYTNLQPLWASDNLSKGAKLPHQLN